MLFDIHVHTTISQCSDIKIDDVLKHARDRGIDGVCITDHDTMNIRHYLREGMQENGLCVIFGMEYTTSDGDFLIFGPFEDIPPKLDAVRLLDLVDQSGGVAIAAHPFRTDRPVSEYVVSKGLCRIAESFNGRNTDIENLKVRRWRHQYDLNECGGSDAHTLDELGKVNTRFTMPVRSRGDLVCALKNGLCVPEWNTLGFKPSPFLEHSLTSGLP